MSFNVATAAARLSIAPMMDWTDRHCRYFHRQISRQALLYTEMVTAPALVRGGAVHLLDYSVEEHPVALQLGGSDPKELAHAARLGADAGYDEINLNVGCPSDRVQSGTFGAVLMKTPGLVAECVAAMAAAVDVPVTVKCRIGVDDQDAEAILPDFIEQVHAAGCTYLIVHARKAWLQGLSPKENRDIPPLDYDLVLRMAAAFPDLPMSINGGIETLEQANALIAGGLNGAMIGRAAYHRPWDILAEADRVIFEAASPVSAREEVIDAMRPYISSHIGKGGRLHQITRHMLGLFAGQPGARVWRRVLSEKANRPGAGLEVLDEALEGMSHPDRLAG
ncbi:tRNA dihydrouridine(20/20a) synthase DusA [Marivita sp. XM-24bin2]|mgnify:CR=1 FL=1|uniref:tRNA dihydrouridine(20/20a) synthase DusA n=1 Tax=unclassified Marivita TaxID=2632480 RepID=UPI000D799978|nr:tRNA dihydrouridine(20/20a) synthase DusA [Marivita sp. XM-24bin2]MCR9107409.1 tRNA dihydrouridine(20/20a) synthase DusA [Paracoccaceae bacterium]PWL35756.1 MAG: tRNA dihydrouridine(20/20a) synthase DusA [Marivita sp. XM-24bin2]